MVGLGRSEGSSVEFILSFTFTGAPEKELSLAGCCKRFASEPSSLLLFSFFETGFYAVARAGLKLIFWPLPRECLITGMLHHAHLRECDLQTQKTRMYL